MNLPAEPKSSTPLPLVGTPLPIAPLDAHTILLHVYPTDAVRCVNFLSSLSFSLPPTLPAGFHAIDMETGAVQDLYLPSPSRGAIHPHAIISLPRSGGSELLLCYNSE